MNAPNLNRPEMESPNPKYHFRISMTKSAIRILGFTMLPVQIAVGVIILVMTEVVGIMEEFT